MGLIVGYQLSYNYLYTRRFVRMYVFIREIYEFL